MAHRHVAAAAAAGGSGSGKDSERQSARRGSSIAQRRPQGRVLKACGTVKIFHTSYPIRLIFFSLCEFRFFIGLCRNALLHLKCTTFRIREARVSAAGPEIMQRNTPGVCSFISEGMSVPSSTVNRIQNQRIVNRSVVIQSAGPCFEHNILHGRAAHPFPL